MAPEVKSVAIIMGSQSDWATMRHAADTLDELGLEYESRIVSAHRTPDRMVAFAKGARAAGFKVIIAGAGGAAHLPGMTASLTELPVLGVPIESKALSGVDSLYSIVQMPAGVPVGTAQAAPPARLARKEPSGCDSVIVSVLRRATTPLSPGAFPVTYSW